MNRNRRKPCAKQKWVIKDVAGGVLVTSNVMSSLAQLNEWRSKGILCDVTIKAGDGVTIQAHRNILAVSSEYFQAMFTSGLQESSSRDVDMSEVDGHLLAALIDFMYTGELKMTVTSAQELLVLTDMLQMDGLKHQAELFMARHLDANNCLGMIEFGRKYSCPQLVDKALSLVKKRFAVVSQSEEFLLLPPGVLKEIISFTDLHLGPKGEDSVLSAVMSWAEHETIVRCPRLTEILPHVDVNAVSPAYLNAVTNLAIVKEHPEIVEMLHAKPSLCMKSLRVPQQHIYAIGGYFQSRTGPSCPRTNGVERFNVLTKEWSTVCPLPILPSSIFAFNIQGRLLVIAFDQHPQENSTGQSTRGLFEYNYLQDQWVDLSDGVAQRVLQTCEEALQPTGAITYCSTRQCLYLLTVNCFLRAKIEEIDGDITMGHLEQLEPLSHLYEEDTDKYHEDDMSLVAHHGQVFAFGGTVRKSLMDYWPSDRVFSYSPEKESWTARKSMMSSRARVGAVSLDSHLYTVGGFGKYRENCTERYDPDADHWEDLANMDKRRSHFCTVTAAGKIWAVGGKSYAFGCGGARKVLKTIESYDVVSDQWTTYGPMKEARCGFAAVVL